MANRQTRRREKKLEKEAKKIETVGSFDSDIMGKLFIVLIVVVALVLFYLLTLYITNKHSTDSVVEDNNVSTESDISYEEIVIGRVFSMNSKDYLVIFYDGNNNDISSTYSELVSNYRTKEDHLPLYYVDMSVKFNSKSSANESNEEASKASELAINGPTLIRITDNKISEYLEGEEDITDYLK